MKARIVITIFYLITLISYGQKIVLVDGDKIVLKDTSNPTDYLLNYIERGTQNQNAIWVSYDRRPGVDPWIREMNNKEYRYTEDNFIQYFKAKGINILGAITTYDDCQCAKCKAIYCPDMYVIHFKILPEDWMNLKEFYPEIEKHLKSVKIR